jgi:RimJ/RimL family protein N-acetyltransferase
MAPILNLKTPRLKLVYIPNTSDSARASKQVRGRYEVSHGGAAIGSVSLIGQSRYHGEIGYSIAADQRGQGFASECVSAVVAAVSRDHGMTLLSASVWSDNAASRRVLEKTGFKAVSSKLSYSQSNAKPRSVVLYSTILSPTPAG